jgi:hypothetical protein
MRVGRGHFLKGYWMASSPLKTRLHSMIVDGAQRCIFEAISSLPFNASAHFFLEVFSPSPLCKVSKVNFYVREAISLLFVLHRFILSSVLVH